MTSPDPMVNDDVNKWYRKWRFAFRDSKYFKSSQLVWVEDLLLKKLRCLVSARPVLITYAPNSSVSFHLQDNPVRTITYYFRFRPFSLSEVLLIIHGKTSLNFSQVPLTSAKDACSMNQKRFLGFLGSLPRKYLSLVLFHFTWFGSINITSSSWFLSELFLKFFWM